MERIAIFIDGAYLEKILLHEFGGVRVDFSKLAQELSQGYSLLRTYYYHCAPYQSSPPTPEEVDRKQRRDRFFKSLERLPRFEVRLGKLAFRGNDADGKPIFQQKRADLMLGVDLVQLSATRQIQAAVLLAGDSDFVPAVEAAKHNGVLVRLVHGTASTSSASVHRELWAICDERQEIDQVMIDSILLA